MSRTFTILLRVLLVMIVTLMALGAGVRTMNAGLSCPDWPLCYGKVIPDFHPAVWFEFVHRAYAGLVAILFVGSSIFVLRSKKTPEGAKRSAKFGLVFLVMQILAGALTVLWLVKWVAVTSHLLLATLFFGATFWMYQSLRPQVDQTAAAPPPRAYLSVAGFIALAVFMQIALGGVVASTYAGSVCVDWPLCNGQWVPTWQGAIGHQITHRFMAYFLAIVITAFAILMQQLRKAPWMTPQILRLSRLNVAVVFLQVVVGIINLVYYIPPSVTVLHQSLAIILFGVNMRTFFVARVLCAKATASARINSGLPGEYPAVLRAEPS